MNIWTSPYRSCTTISNARVIIVIIIITRHELDLERPVQASSNSLFKGLASRLRPFGLKLSIIFAILQLFILVTRHNQFYLHLPSFLSTGSNFNFSKISSLRLWSKKDITLYDCFRKEPLKMPSVNHKYQMTVTSCC